jgi:hypothetical protein
MDTDELLDGNSYAKAAGGIEKSGCSVSERQRGQATQRRILTCEGCEKNSDDGPENISSSKKVNMEHFCFMKALYSLRQRSRLKRFSIQPGAGDTFAGGFIGHLAPYERPFIQAI